MKYTENETISQKQLFSQASVSMLGLSLMAVPEFMRFSLKTMIFGLVLTGLFFWFILYNNFFLQNFYFRKARLLFLIIPKPVKLLKFYRWKDRFF